MPITSAAAEVTPGVRKQIVAALAGALRNEVNRRPMWLVKDGGIRQEGAVDQHLYRALLRVSGITRQEMARRHGAKVPKAVVDRTNRSDEKATGMGLQ